MSKQSNQDKLPKRNRTVFFIIILCVLGSGYWFIRHQQDNKIADNVFAQMKQLDAQLDKLQSDARIEQDIQALNRQIATSVGSLTPQSYAQNQSKLLALVESTNFYAPNVESTFKALILQTDAKHYKFQRRGFQLQVRELKYDYNQDVQNFNSQTQSIASQLAAMESDIAKIRNDDLRDLETARLKFMHRKLEKTDHQIKTNLAVEVLEDIEKSNAETESN